MSRDNRPPHCYLASHVLTARGQASEDAFLACAELLTAQVQETIGPSAHVFLAHPRCEGARCEVDHLIVAPLSLTPADPGEEERASHATPPPRRARGEIFVTAQDQVLYVDERRLFALESEVLRGFYLHHHGAIIGPDLDRDLRRRLRHYARDQALGDGWNGPTIRTLVEMFVEDVWRVPPRDWTWRHLDEAFAGVVQTHQSRISQTPDRWVIHEIMFDDEEEERPSSCCMVIHEALVEDDESAGHVNRQRLVLASPRWANGARPDPERETIREPDPGELFVTSRDVAWFDERRQLRWIEGEVAHRLLKDRHGQVLADPEGFVRQAIADDLFQTAQIPDNIDPGHALDLIYTMLEDRDVLALWQHDVEDIATAVAQHLAAFSAG
ncbi:MAG: hypothetical protein RLY93_12170 [Sumerlaeia bacterium]